MELKLIEQKIANAISDSCIHNGKGAYDVDLHAATNRVMGVIKAYLEYQEPEGEPRTVGYFGMGKDGMPILVGTKSDKPKPGKRLYVYENGVFDVKIYPQSTAPVAGYKYLGSLTLDD